MIKLLIALVFAGFIFWKVPRIRRLSLRYQTVIFAALFFLMFLPLLLMQYGIKIFFAMLLATLGILFWIAIPFIVILLIIIFEISAHRRKKTKKEK